MVCDCAILSLLVDNHLITNCLLLFFFLFLTLFLVFKFSVLKEGTRNLKRKKNVSLGWKRLVSFGISLSLFVFLLLSFKRFFFWSAMNQLKLNENQNKNGEIISEKGNATEVTTVWRIGTKYNGRHGNTTTSNDI